jgi:putative peptidoglycan lipid II flippase
MAGSLWLSMSLVSEPSLVTSGIAHAALLAIAIAGGIAVYGLLLVLLGVTGWRETVNAIRQPRDLRA